MANKHLEQNTPPADKKPKKRAKRAKKAKQDEVSGAVALIEEALRAETAAARPAQQAPAGEGPSGRHADGTRAEAPSKHELRRQARADKLARRAAERADKPVEFRQEQTPEERRMTGRDIRRAVLTLVLAAVLLAASVVIWLYRDRFDPDRLVLSNETTAVAKEEYIFDSGTGQLFASVGRGLAAATSSGIELMDSSGQIAVSRLFQMETPAIAAGPDYAVFYDLGGTNIAAAFFDGTVRELHPSGNILSATVSSGGYLALTTECTGYRGLVTVYDPTLEPVYEWYASSVWILSGEISPDGRQLAVLCYTASGSEVRFFRLDNTEQQAAFSVSNTVLLDARWTTSDTLCAYTTDQALFFDSDGRWIDTFSFGGQYLTACSFDGDGFAAFALSPYRTGTTATLVSLDTNGRELGTAAVQSEIVSLTCSGTEVLVLCPDGAQLYSSSLTEKGRLTGLSGFKYGLLRSRGEALLISSNYAEVYTF